MSPLATNPLHAKSASATFSSKAVFLGQWGQRPSFPGQQVQQSSADTSWKESSQRDHSATPFCADSFYSTSFYEGGQSLQRSGCLSLATHVTEWAQPRTASFLDPNHYSGEMQWRTPLGSGANQELPLLQVSPELCCAMTIHEHCKRKQCQHTVATCK